VAGGEAGGAHSDRDRRTYWVGRRGDARTIEEPFAAVTDQLHHVNKFSGAGTTYELPMNAVPFL
jgi:hypothetical protein